MRGFSLLDFFRDEENVRKIECWFDKPTMSAKNAGVRICASDPRGVRPLAE
jgi:hypothetical protein